MSEYIILKNVLDQLKTKRKLLMVDINNILNNDQTTNYIKETSIVKELRELASVELQIKTLKKHYFKTSERS